MDYFVLVAVLVVTAYSIGLHLFTRAKKTTTCPGKLPPGSLGLPVIGHTLGFLRAAARADGGEAWLRDRIRRYGHVSKFSLFGTPTVLLAGPAANKFMFFSGSLPLWHPRSTHRIMGDKNILTLYGDDHRRIRGALMEFLKPDVLKLYVGRIDAGVRRHLEENWAGRAAVTVVPLMKRLTFDIITSLLFSLEAGPKREALAGDFMSIIEGMMAFPVDLPFTAFGRSLKASRRARRILEGITRERKAKLAEGKASASDDLICRLLSLTDDRGQQLLTDEEIVNNSMITLLAGNDTTSVLITFMVRHLADDPHTLAAMVQEHEEIARHKADGEALTLEDLSKMKFTWRVAQEILRIVPPILGGMRRAVDDLEFDGYSIPKGWQVYWAPSVTHMDPSIFPEPAKFDPSRFEKDSSASRPPCSYVPFSAGNRICPGLEFARIETLVTMHHLVRHFRWKLASKDNTFVRDPMPSPRHGLPIELEQF